MSIYDVVVVGAGPAGCRTAYVAAKHGLKTLLVEEHKEVGKPSHCASMVYAKAFEEFDLPRESIINKVKGCFFYSPNNLKLTLCKNEVESYVVDREVFDLKLAEKACDAGAKLALSTRFYDIQQAEGKTRILKMEKNGSTFEVKTWMVVDAEGWNSIIARKFNFQKNLVYLKGIQYEMVDVNFNHKEYVELYFGEKFFPGFFAWIIPLTDGKARIGLCVKNGFSPIFHLDKALKHHPIISRKTRGGKTVKAFGGVIPIHGPISKTFGEGLLVVGDSAGQVKSTSGGGIYFGLKAADIAGKVAVKCLEDDRIEATELSLYEEKWKKEFGRELRFTSFARKLVDRFSDEELDQFFRLVVEDSKLTKIIEQHGDTAYQSRLYFPFIFRLGKLTLQKPAILKLAFRTFLEMATHSSNWFL